MTTLIATLVLLGCSESEPPCTPDIAAWEDHDGDGFGGVSVGKVCALEEGQVEVAQDCDDENDQLSPAAVEVCDGIDNDCDGQIDDGAGLKQWWFDHDGDGYGSLYQSKLTCQRPEGQYVSNSADCDDFDGAVSPEGNEVCGGGDEDCDGYLDEADDSVDPASFTTFFADKDSDTYGDRNDTIEGCRLLPGYVLEGNDCNDDNPLVTQAVYYADADGDGYGDPSITQLACQRPPPGTVDNGLDCDDADPSLTYESDWFDDLDGDGWGSGVSLAFDCVPPDNYAVNQGGDCDEGDPNENPGSPEDCSDGIDNNCDGAIDADDIECLPPCADQGIETNANGSTAGETNDFSPSCAYSVAGDVSYYFVAPSTGTWTFDLAGSTYDTVMAVYAACGGLQLGCNDDSYGIASPSRVAVYLTEGQSVIVDVDGYSNATGSYDLAIY